MRSYERNGIHVDQCTECRGLFLDRGELEHLVQAESSFYGQSPPAPAPAPAPRAPEPHRGHDTFVYKGHRHPKRKKHFLEELFD